MAENKGNQVAVTKTATKKLTSEEAMQIFAEARILENQAKEKRQTAEKALPKLLKEIAQKALTEARYLGCEPEDLANEIIYLDDPKKKPKIFLSDNDGVEQFSHGPRPEWLKKMQAEPDYSKAKHYKRSLQFASCSFEKAMMERKIQTEERKEAKKKVAKKKEANAAKKK